MRPVSNELIAASAGTGKTYQLTNRYLKLLFATGEPERIIALTFTRKAAGEFFEKIFHRLACAASDEAEAASLARELGRPVDRAACLGHLRLLLDRLHRLQLSTYDSFFSRIVRSFPFELGLGAPPALMDDREQGEAARRAQAELLAMESRDQEKLQEFWHAFKRATMGREEKRITDLLDGYIAEHQILYLEEPDAAKWGAPSAIWPAGCPWGATGDTPAGLARELGELLAWKDLTPAQGGDWRAFLEDLGAWQPPGEMPASVKKFSAKFIEILPDLDRGAAVLTVRRKQALGPELCSVAARVARTCVWLELEPRLQATRGIHEIIALFEAIYRRDVRGLGRLTIDDMTRLLGGAEGGGLGDEEMRLALDYRLDGAFDHWLLDEFQDTSRSQWSAIANLVDEVLQDADGSRSFFAVGDTKQSLYMWRGSDDRLFERVSGRYAGSLVQRKLAESYRSSAPVLGMVNGVFGAAAAIGEICGSEVASRWGAMWSEHRCAARLAERSGHAAWLLCEGDEAALRAETLRLLRAIDPLSRGLSVAVLTQTNADAEALVDYLRREGRIPCALASEVKPGADNAAAVALGSLMRLTAHPGDSLAWNHLRMTPPGARLAEARGGQDGLAAHVRELVATGGMQAAVEEWIRAAAPLLAPDDHFSRERLDQCLACAREFDEAGQTDMDAFLRELDGLRVRETDVPGQIAVMTVHKAKGLDWDLVVLADIEGKSLRERRAGMAVQRDDDGAVQWILQAPRKDVCLADEVLSAQVGVAEDDAAFEQLCVLYVAMTRARMGLYVVSSDPSKTKSPNFVSLLRETLGVTPRQLALGSGDFTCAWELGQSDWFGREPGSNAEPPAPPVAQAVLPPDERPRRARPTARRPADEIATEAAGAFWHPADGLSREFGMAVHAALARIEWLSPEEGERAGQLGALVQDLAPPVAARVRRIVDGAPEVFVAEGAATSVWREKPFEVLVDDDWVSGQFDRVLIERDSAGRATGALIADFKTSARDQAARYEGQLQLYRRSLARLLALPEEAIRVRIVT